MAKVHILKMQRNPANGSLQAVYAFTRTLVVTETKESGHPPRPDGWTQEQHEAEFLRRLQAETDAATAGDAAVDVVEMEGQTVEELLVNAPAPPVIVEPAAAAARSAAARKKAKTATKTRRKN